MDLMEIYNQLLKEYGPQGWWPILNFDVDNSIKNDSVNGYHVMDYSFPRNENERFEIIIGTLLTQNTSWSNVEKAIRNLDSKGLLDAFEIFNCDILVLKELIRPAGYFNQKAERLKILAKFFIDLNGEVPNRKQLLSLKGIGPETADSILLYAYGITSFVVDSYTKRIFQNLGFISKEMTYDEIKESFEKALKKDFKIYQEFHALIVKHAKNYYLGKKNGEGDFLRIVL